MNYSHLTKAQQATIVNNMILSAETQHWECVCNHRFQDEKGRQIHEAKMALLEHAIKDLTEQLEALGEEKPA